MVNHLYPVTKTSATFKRTIHHLTFKMAWNECFVSPIQIYNKPISPIQDSSTCIWFLYFQKHFMLHTFWNHQSGLLWWLSMGRFVPVGNSEGISLRIVWLVVSKESSERAALGRTKTPEHSTIPIQAASSWSLDQAGWRAGSHQWS